jgi:hypothetical protein
MKKSSFIAQRVKRTFYFIVSQSATKAVCDPSSNMLPIFQK